MTALAEMTIEAEFGASLRVDKYASERDALDSPNEDVDEFLIEIARHKDAFYRFVKRTVWDQAVAEDVFSSAVMTAYENRDKYMPGTNFRAWMFRILLNKCFVANRETRRSSVRLDDIAEPSRDDSPGIRTVDVLGEPMKILDECSDEVYRAFRKLSTAQRACIMLRGVERYSYREIAEVLSIPIGTVMTHLRRGRMKLRTELAEYASQQGILRSTYSPELESD